MQVQTLTKEMEIHSLLFSLKPKPPWMTITPYKSHQTHLTITCSSHSHPHSIHQSHKSLNKHTLFITHHNNTNKTLSFIEKLKNKSTTLCPENYGDLDNTHFWAVVDYLSQSSRFLDISKVFDAWTSMQQSRINEFNYIKIIAVLCDVGFMSEATLKLQNMKDHGFQLCLEPFNSIIHGYARKGMFNEALQYINEMKDTGVNPDTETYDGLIKAYGKYQMYDEMVNCLKMMESSGCTPDYVTYNLLIRELSKHGLLNKMERMYHTLLSKKMDLQSSTLFAMVEAYANFGLLDKMEKYYTKLVNSKTFLKEGLVRKIGKVYIENYMFSKLDDLAYDVAFKNGRTDLFWHLHLLSHACLLSKKGIYSVNKEMEEARIPWSITIANIILLAFMKMNDFTRLSALLSELPNKHLDPDIVTFGIIYDARVNGFDWSNTLRSWKKYGYLDNELEVNTDLLVSVAFGKGLFLKTIEELNSLLDPEARKEKRWTYGSLIDFVIKHHKNKPKLDA